MTDLARLREALDEWNNAFGTSTVTAGGMLADAARSFLDLMENGERKFWCLRHDWIWTAPEHFYRCAGGTQRDEDCEGQWMRLAPEASE